MNFLKKKKIKTKKKEERKQKLYNFIKTSYKFKNFLLDKIGIIRQFYAGYVANTLS